MSLTIKDLQRPEEVIIEKAPNKNQSLIDSLYSMRDVIKNTGVNISMMEIVEDVCPNTLPPETPLNTFTTELSEVNKDEALNAVDAAIQALETDGEVEEQDLTIPADEYPLPPGERHVSDFL